MWQLKMTIRVGENELWARGVHFHAPEKHAARYTTAREADPDLTAMRTRIGQLLDGFGLRMETQMIGLYKEVMALEAVQGRVQGLYDEMRVGEGKEKELGQRP